MSLDREKRANRPQFRTADREVRIKMRPEDEGVAFRGGG